MADDIERPRPPPNRRRDKVQLSCDQCRHRKLRCDRHRPCGACSRRGLTDSCKYPTTSSSTPVAPRPSANLHERISELETLVVTLMEGGQPLPTPLAPKSPRSTSLSSVRTFSDINIPKRDSTDQVADPGTLKLRDAGSSYVQSAHWEAVLDKIRGLKEDVVADGSAVPGSHLFYGPNRHATLEEILSAIPPRPVVDRLMAFHFDSYIVTPYLIHSKKFLREFESFWKDPSKTSIAWIGLMFSMLYIAAQLQAFTIDVTHAQADSLKAEHLTMKDAFREKTVQCLNLAGYTMGGPYILETLIMILTGEYILLKDNAADGWLFSSTILHIAIRMGYHRDPDHFAEISPFEGEMRRRIWLTILQLDISLSLEMGLPRSATDTHIDTKQPRNFLDSDFDEATKEMPRPRPETEWTPVLPLIGRGRLISALGPICDINAGISPPSYDEVLKVDALLEDVHKTAVPPVLRWETMPHPITDSPNLVVQRVSVETTYHKSRILLYRRACTGRQSQDLDKESVRICLDSALKILSFQEMLHEESQPFGRLSQLRWKVTHIFNQDVLLATSVLCLYLQDVDKLDLPKSAGQTTWSSRIGEIRERLTTSHKIWRHMSAASAEAGKVAKALSIVLGIIEVSAEKTSSGQPTSYNDPLTDFETMPLNGFGGAFSDQYFTSGFYDPLTFFDNLLESEGI